MNAIQAYWTIRRWYIEHNLPMQWCPTLKDIKRLHKDGSHCGHDWHGHTYIHIIAQETQEEYWQKKCGCRVCIGPDFELSEEGRKILEHAIATSQCPT